MRYLGRLASYLKTLTGIWNPNSTSSSDWSIRDNFGSAPPAVNRNLRRSSSDILSAPGAALLTNGKDDEQAFLRVQLASARSELDRQASDIQQKSVDIGRLEKKLKDERFLAKGLQKELAEEAVKVATLKKEIRSLRRQLSKAVEAEGASQSELSRLQQRTRRQKREIETLKKVGEIIEREEELPAKQKSGDASGLEQSRANQAASRSIKLLGHEDNEDDEAAPIAEHRELVAFNLLQQGKERGFLLFSEIRRLVDTPSDRVINGDAIVEFFHRNGINVYDSPFDEESASSRFSRRTSAREAEVFASKMHEELLGILHSSTDIPEANPNGAVHMLQELGEFEMAQRVRMVTDDGSLTR